MLSFLNSEETLLMLKFFEFNIIEFEFNKIYFVALYLLLIIIKLEKFLVPEFLIA